MNKLFKHTKKLVLLALTVVMMVSTAMVVSAGTSEEFGALDVLKVAKSATVYVNGVSENEQSDVVVDELLTGKEDADMVELYNFVKLDVDASIKKKSDVDITGDNKVTSKDVYYVNGAFKVKSSDESVATVEEGVDEEGNQYIIIKAGKKTGKATITLTEEFPKNVKKPKTAKVTVTVKSLVDDIAFDSAVVTPDEEGAQSVTVGLGGSVKLGTATNADASNKKVTYQLLGDAKKYISVKNGVITTVKKAEALEEGYVEVLVRAQDQEYDYKVVSKKNGKEVVTTKSAAWGYNEIVRVYVKNPEVASVKIQNVALSNEKAYLETSAKKQKAQSYATINLKTNASSKDHTFKLQTVAYSGKQWGGEVKENALTFTSSNPKIATVDANGVITAVANSSKPITITIAPKDGVKLAKLEAVTVKVNVSTDLEYLNVAEKEATALVGKYSIKASVNANVSNKNDKTIQYKILGEDEFAKQVAKNSKKTLSKGQLVSEEDGTVTVRVYSKGQPNTFYKDVTITFVDGAKSLTAKVMSYGSKSAKLDAKTTLYVNGKDEAGNTINNTSVINVTGKTILQNDITDITNLTAVSSNPAVATVAKEGNNFVITAVSAGKANITVSATDGSNVKAKGIAVTVQSKVNEITVANAGVIENENVIYFELAKAGKATTIQFKANTNEDATSKGLAYDFIYSNEEVDFLNGTNVKVDKAKGKVTVDKAATTKLQEMFEDSDVNRIYIGDLTVAATDFVNYKYDAAAVVNHAAYVMEEPVKVYVVAEPTYMTYEEFEDAIDAALAKHNGGAEGITLTKGEKLDLGADVVIPADVTSRTLEWGTSNNKNIAVKNGVITASKVTPLGAGEIVSVVAHSGLYEEDPSGKLVEVNYRRLINVRVVDDQKTFGNALNDQVTKVLKENNYTWLGGKPSFDDKKATLTFAISDITMSKEAANSEMREQLTSVFKVLKDAAKVATDGTATQYVALTITDGVNEWALVKVGANVQVSANGTVIGTYAFTEVDAAISDLTILITEDIDEIVEWANKNLSVTVIAENSAKVPVVFETQKYVTNYTVAVTIKEADVEKYLDMKVNEAVVKFANANDRTVTGIESVTYDADTNTATVDIFDGHKEIAGVYAEVKEDAIASLNDIFTKAVSATIEVDGTFETRVLEYVRGTESDVNKLVDDLYAEIAAKYTEMTGLEGVKAVATVNFDFSGIVYTKQYNLVFKRTAATIDADVDSNVEGFLADLKANPYATLEYVSSENLAVVTVNDFAATLGNAVSVIDEVEAFVNKLTGDVFAKTATVTTTTLDAEGKEVTVNTVFGVAENAVAGLDQITATQVLNAIKPEWKEDGEVLNRTLTELLGKTVAVKVTYSNGQELYYTIKFQADYDKVLANLNAVIDASVAAMNSVEVEEEVIFLEAYKEAANAALIIVNDAKLDAEVLDLAGTGVYTMLETVLETAKANCGQTVTVTVGKEDVTPVLRDIDKAMVSDLVADLKVSTIKDLTKKPVYITIGLLDGRSVEYVVEFVAESIEGKSAMYPLFATELEFALPVRQGNEVHLAGFIAGMVLTVTGEDAYIVYNETVYPAVDGVATVLIPEPMMPGRMPVNFAIGNSSSEAATYDVAITYPVGHMMNPEEMSELSSWGNYYTGSTVANKGGYYYKYTAIADGTVTLAVNVDTKDVTGDIIATNEKTSAQYTLSEDYTVNEYGETVLALDVKKGDVFVIEVAAMVDDFFYQPAMDYTLVASFTYPLGSEQNPITLDLYEIPGGTQVYVPAKETVYVQSYAIGGTEMTLSDGTGNAVVTYNGKTYKTNKTTKTIKVEFEQPMGRQPVVFAVKNPNKKAVSYSIDFAYPAGHMMNPVVIEETGAVEAKIKAGSQGYYFTWTAAEAGTFTFDVSATSGNWMYNVNNMTSYVYGETHWSDEETPVKAESVFVNAGDELQIMVNTYDPANPWSAPAGTIKATTSFVKAGASEIADKAVDTVITSAMWDVLFSGNTTIVDASYNAASNNGTVSLNKADAANDVVGLASFWSALESVLAESKTQGAKTVDVDLYIGEEKKNETAAELDLATEITSGTIGSIVDGFGIKTIGDLDGKTIKMTVDYDGFALEYNIVFAAVEVEVEE